MFKKLLQGKKLSYSESYKLFKNIIFKKLTQVQLTAVLISMKMRGETTDEIAGAVSALLNYAKPFPRPEYPFADIVGTGGDCSNGLNISTISAIIASSCGAYIVKHGNKSSSGCFGSSDLLSSIGIKLNLSSNQSRFILDKLGICFLFAPNYHPVLYSVRPIRKQLKTSTIFNILGPLINPSKPPYLMIGVYSSELIIPIAKVLQKLNYKHAIVINGGGMDEVVLHTQTKVAELCDNHIEEYSLSAFDFGLKTQSLNKEYVKDRGTYFKNFLQGKGKYIDKLIIAANVAMLLKLFGFPDIKENTSRALHEINSGNSYDRIIKLIKLGSK